MSYFFENWEFVLMLGSPFALLMLVTIFLIGKSNYRAYRMGWLNLLLFLIISVLVSLYSYILDKEPGSGGKGFAALFHIIHFASTQLVLFWLWLYKIKLEKQSEPAEKSKILDKDDPILDEDLPTK
jgi:FtsH-binding integral membrane protein